jgi:hypothetical protein
LRSPAILRKTPQDSKNYNHMRKYRLNNTVSDVMLLNLQHKVICILAHIPAYPASLSLKKAAERCSAA